MKKTLFIFFLFTITHVTWAKKYDPPKISAVEAIEIAKTYIATKNIKISDTSFISEIIYKNIYNEYKPAHWSIKWHIVPRVKGGLIEIRVYNGGKVEPIYDK